MLEPGLEHILSDDERVGCGTSTGLEPTTYIQHKQQIKRSLFGFSSKQLYPPLTSLFNVALAFTRRVVLECVTYICFTVHHNKVV